MDLDLGKIIEHCNSFLTKFRESYVRWVPWSQGESRNFAKKIRWRSSRSVTQLGRIGCGKSLLDKSKLTNLKKSGWPVVGGRRVQKSICIQVPSLWRFPGIAHTQEKRRRVACMSSTRLLRWAMKMCGLIWTLLAKLSHFGRKILFLWSTNMKSHAWNYWCY